MNQCCLAMIVKDESHVIERSLRSAAGYVDCYCIGDTGSTDDTKEVIKKVMEEEGIPGEIFDIEWKGFGDARTRVLDRIRELEMAKYALILDADEYLEGNKKVITLKNATVGKVLMKTEGIEFWTPRILDMSLPWKYEGTVHEIPTTERAAGTEYTGFQIIHGADGATWKDPEKYNKHVELAKQQDMSVPRHQFYLAQSLRAAGRLNEALVEYRKRAEMKDGWYQEAVYSQLMIGRIYEWQGENEKALIEFMKCYEMDCERTEALCAILRLMKEMDMFKIGTKVGEELLKKKDVSSDKLFAEKIRWDTIYMDLGLCEYYTGNKQKAKEYWEKILEMEEADERIVEQTKKNLEFVK